MSTKITWHGHSAFTLETAKHKIVIDPFFTDNPANTTPIENIEADFILLTHGHGDHVGDVVSLAKRTNALVISIAEIAMWLGQHGVKNTHGQNIGGSYKHPFGEVKLTIAHHSSALPDGSNGGDPAGLLLTLDEGKLYHAGDTGLFLDMQLIGEEGIDVAILPIGDNYTMGIKDAVRAVKFVQPKIAIPTHYNTWPVIQADPEQWAALVKQETKAKPVVIPPGGSWVWE
ncbi:MAG: metal-dependent hydrolase [Planctomycetota bacterium]|nr:metal-dependent hydrolase [Planctomycetota bacterium]MDA1212124.1 metal-dependent hydrolase [Planctomycetota bacterium]